MLLNKSLLVILDEQDEAMLSLHRSALIARKLKCPLKVLWLGKDMVKVAQLEGQLNSRGLFATVSTCDPGSMLREVKRLWQAQHFALLVKLCDPRHQGFFGSRDNQLLRELPCPVLLVKHDYSWLGGRVMAAVNPLAEDGLHRQLNRDVLRIAAQISQATEGQVVAVAASPAAMMGADPEMQSQSLIDGRVASSMELILSEAEISEAALAVGEGPAEHWISKVATEQQAALVVIGTKARSGIQGALIGNTAERILHRLDADVLVVRSGLSDSVVPMLQ